MRMKLGQAVPNARVIVSEIREPEAALGNVCVMLGDIVELMELETVARRPKPTVTPLRPLRDEVRGRLGNYELLHRIGAGGMGEVFLACDASDDGNKTPVALKRILPGLANRLDIKQLFVDEARLTTRMTHRNLVPAMDTSFADSHGFFTMPFVDGIPLTTLLRAAARGGKAIPDGAALRIVQSVATGLHHAHEFARPSGRPLEVVHCDVSPGNVLVSRRGEVKLLDWGIARGHHVTRGLPEMARGTLGYSSPEQSAAKRADRRSDVFSLGVILWELTTMRRLFRGVNRADTALRVANAEVPRPSTVRADYPADLEDITMRALARDKDERLASALSLDIAIERLVRRRELDASRRALAAWVRSIVGSDDEPSTSG